MKKKTLTPTEIVIHLSGTPTDEEYDRSDELEGHFSDVDPDADPIPYHYLLPIAGGRSMGRKKTEVCHHCEGHDTTSYSIMLVGGIDYLTEEECDTSTPEQLDMLAYTIRELRLKNPNLTIHTPHELDPYCTEVEFDLEKFKSLYPDLFNK